ncbi:hypothetical protein GWI33_001814 [Rhynchophorus ferrugineus]|uniref:Uncharacterized protein n=1 Tax=Rhynchophorus ferrugineus TaxID=354439 RepID=A0A834IYZ5_RHYFE|nr:hypothetical protein GWI33_001814 [Rhynchophorus ferrugineus]
MSLFGSSSYNPPLEVLTTSANSYMSPIRNEYNTAPTPRCEVSPDPMDLDLGLLWRELAGLRLDEFCRLQLTRTR